MTTFRQTDYEAITQEGEKRKKKEPTKSHVKISTTKANPQDMLTVRELECVTAVFRSFETGVRSATIYPKVGRQDKTRQDRTGQDKTRQDKIRQDKTRQRRTRQERIRQDKTRQDKTGQDKKRKEKKRQDNIRQDKIIMNT